MPREDVRFNSGDAHCAAWFYPAAGGEGEGDRAPCVVMGHGFSLTRGDGLDLYAQALADGGANVLVFDFRFLGDSGGTPRQRFRAPLQREDFRSAVAYARGRPEVDPRKIVLWGFSFSGGHVTRLLSEGFDVAGAILLCPFVDGLKRVASTPPAVVGWILPRALADLAGRHNLIPVTAEPGEKAAMTLPGEAAGFAISTPEGSRWRNEISPGLFATVGLFRPVTKAGSITVPIWVGRCADDISADFGAIGKLAAKASMAELHDFPGDHFDPFHGELPAQVAASQVDFVRRRFL